MKEQLMKELKRIFKLSSDIKINTEYSDLDFSSIKKLPLPVETKSVVEIRFLYINPDKENEIIRWLTKHGLKKDIDYVTDKNGNSRTPFVQFFFSEKSFAKLHEIIFGIILNISSSKLGEWMLKNYVLGKKAQDPGYYSETYTEIQLLNEIQWILNYQTKQAYCSFESTSSYKKNYLSIASSNPNLLREELIHLFNVFNQQLKLKHNTQIYFQIYPDNAGIFLSLPEFEALEKLGFQPNTRIIDDPIFTESQHFISIIKKFKKEHGIKNLRREVFGLSENDSEMQKILALKKAFFNLPGILDFITQRQLIDSDDKVNLTQAFEILHRPAQKQVVKYLSIILGRITLDQLKHPTKYEHDHLYDLHGGNSQKNTSDKAWIEEKKKINQIPGLFQYRKKLDSDELSDEIKEFQAGNDIKEYMPWITKVVIKTPIPSFCHFNPTVLDQTGFNNLFNQKFLPEERYAIFFYAHPHIAGKKYGEHTSLILCEIKNGVINEKTITNIDSYHNIHFFDLLGEKYPTNKQEKICHRLVITDRDHVKLQETLNQDFNCPIYAAHFAEALFAIMSAKEPAWRLEDLFSSTGYANQEGKTVYPSNSEETSTPLGKLGLLIRHHLGDYFMQHGEKWPIQGIRATHNDIRLKTARKYLQDLPYKTPNPT